MRPREAAALLLVPAIALALWLPGLHAYFDLDDFVLLEGSRSAFLRAPGWPSWLAAVFLDEGIVDHNYRPLSTHVVFLGLQRLFGATPEAFHALSLLLHVGTALLVAALARRLGLGTAAALGGALFYVSRDALFSAVAWAAGVQDVLMAAFALASLLALSVAVARERGSRRLPWQALSVLLMLGAFLAKESAYVLPALATATALAFARPREGRPGWTVAAASVPHWIACVLFAAFRALVLPLNLEQYPLSVPLESLGRPGIYAFWNLLGFPLEAGEPPGLFAAAAGLGWMVIAVWVWAGLRYARGRRDAAGGRAVAFGAAFWLLSVGFLTVQLWRFHMYYLSLPAAGAALAVAGVVELVLGARPASRTRAFAAIALVAALVASGGLLVRRKFDGALPSGGYYVPARAAQNRMIRDYVERRSPRLAGIRRVIFLEWIDRGVVGADPDGQGYRGVSPIASMLRHHFERPDLEVLYSFPAGSPTLRVSREQAYLTRHVTSHELAMPEGPRPDDLVVVMQ